MLVTTYTILNNLNEVTIRFFVASFNHYSQVFTFLNVVESLISMQFIVSPRKEMEWLYFKPGLLLLKTIGCVSGY